jgi:hypothetical protein
LQHARVIPEVHASSSVLSGRPSPDGANHEGRNTMINHMVSWLEDHGHHTHGANAEGVIWAIDRSYPGGFSRFVRQHSAPRRAR